MSTQKLKDNSELHNNPLKERIKKLMTEKELDTPYSFATRVGLSKGTFTGIWVDGRKSLHKSTLDKICSVTGANPAWLTTGIGEPFDNLENKEKISIKEEVSRLEEKNEMPEMNTDLLTQAFQTLDNALEQTKKVMPPAGRSRFITAVYDSLRTNDGIDLELLKDSIYTLEEALKLKRQFMTPVSKTRLILAIYELYSGDALYKEAIQHTINQLIGSAYEGSK